MTGLSLFTYEGGVAAIRTAAHIILAEIVLRMEGIVKNFPGVQALKGVSFDLKEGEVHALLGENGAGKSTLMNVLSGIYPPDGGKIYFHGKELALRNPMDAINSGISIIHQELALAEQLTVADNMFMGEEPVNRLGFIDTIAIKRRCQEILDSLNSNLSPGTRVYTLSTAQKQMLEIGKAISRDCKVLVMDEPTAAVSKQEVDKIFDLIRSLKNRGICIVYISHRMDEIFQVADRVTVLRDGRNVDTVDVSGITQSELIQMMVGYNLDQYYAKSNCEIGNIVLETEGLTRSDGRARDISIKLRKGEIVGLAGLVGSGRTEFIQMLYGISPAKSGSIRINGKEVSIRNVQDALKNGICLVPEDRKLQGLVLINNVKFNLTISVLEKFFRFIGLSTRRENEIANSFVKKLAIKISSLSQQVMKLSGGNQQKIVIAKWLARESDILLLDEPTRGVDVGAKAEIYSLMDSIASQGKCIIMVSSELPEVINMSDHIYVLRDGNVVAEFRKNEIDQEKVLAYALGAGTNGQ